MNAVDPLPLLVGEANPYGAHPAHALYPYPERSAGGRLCRVILGLEPRQYLRRFERRNLCATQWRVAEARLAAATIAVEAADRAVVLLGAKVSAAFDLEFRPFTLFEPVPGGPARFVVLPHPSGLCRIWNEPDAVDRARRVLADAGVL